MAPIKSSLARSVGKLLGVFKDTDLSLRGDVQSLRVAAAAKTVASGGTKFTSGDQTYHLFHTSSTLVMANDGGEDLTAEIFLVAGGGAGTDGGGGAGGIRNVSSVALSAGETWTCTVGAGGNPSGGPAGSASGRPNWSPGSSQANDLVGRHTDFYFQPVSYPNPKYYRAIGGGKGGVWGNSGGPGGSGGGAGNRAPSGSGGGANSNDGTPISAPGQYGNAGGACTGSGEPFIGGGGGGAGGGGTPGNDSDPTSTRGNGGNGQPFPAYASPIIGPQLSTAGVPGPEVTAFNNAVGPTGRYGGGGGGGGRQPGDDSGTAGGPGGGGAGGSGNSSGTAGEPGIKYTGGGGGGGGFNAPNTTYGPGGGGGTGIIIIKYPT